MKRLNQFIILCFSFFITLSVIEIYLRVSRIGNVSRTEFYPDIGRGRRQNLNYLYFNEGFGVGKINEYRYIGEANAQKKNKNTIRIILLGDSYIEAFQVFERHYFGTFAKKHLSRIYPDINFEILNLGRAGFDLANMYAYQKTLADKFNPDFILYMISVDDLAPKNKDKLLPKVYAKEDTILISTNFDVNQINLFNKTKFFTQNFCFFNMLNTCRKKAQNTPFSSVIFDKFYTLFYRNEKVNEFSGGNISHGVYNVKPITKKIIKTLDSSKVIIVNRDNIAMPNEFIELCVSNGLTYFDLSTKLIELKENGQDPNKWKVTNKWGHWNYSAHKSIGFELANKLDELIKSKKIDLN